MIIDYNKIPKINFNESILAELLSYNDYYLIHLALISE